MSQDDYQKKIEEHRQSIGGEDEEVELRRSRRTNSGKKPKKKSKIVLIPALFFVFLLILVCIFIYVQFFYTPKEAEQAEEAGIIHVETKPISNNPNEKEEDTTPVEDKDSEVSGQTPVDQVPEKEEPKVEEPKVEQPKEQVVKEEPKKEAPAKTHVVKENENLYRIALKYYNDPKAVEKIKAANGLSTNDISVGQTLILP